MKTVKSLALLSLLVLGSVGSALGATTYIIQPILPDGTGGKSANADYATIVDAMASISFQQGDILLVRESWYSEQVSAGSTPLPGYDPIVTTFSGDIDYPSVDIAIIADLVYANEGKVLEIVGSGGRPVVFFPTSDNTRSSLLEGFTVRGGGGGLTDPFIGDITALVGGGIACFGATPTIRNCLVTGNGVPGVGVNSVTLGGGIYASRGDISNSPYAGPLIDSCEIVGNRAVADAFGSTYEPTGGGVFAYQCQPEFVDTKIWFNEASYAGGGAAIQNQTGVGEYVAPMRPVFDGCDVEQNTAGSRGGGLYFFVHVNPVLLDCRIRNNSAAGNFGEGGGMYWDNCIVEMSSCVIAGNNAEVSGGGILMEGEGAIAFPEDSGAAQYAASRLTHCTVQLNEVRLPSGSGGLGVGGGVSIRLSESDGVVAFENCLIVNNSAGDRGGVNSEDASVIFMNCTIARNTSRDGFGHGGLYYHAPGGDIGPWILDVVNTIITENRAIQSSPANVWEVDFYRDPGVPNFTSNFGYSLMSNAAGWADFQSSGTNVLARAHFATGPSSVLFPANGFYLSYIPPQSVLSLGYDAGSAGVGPAMAVYGMTCRTQLQPDSGVVDIGFHYPPLGISVP